MLTEPLYARMMAGKREGILDDLLPIAIKKYQAGFSRFADCGAGVGKVSTQYGALLDAHLEPENRHSASVECFEPLPENVVVLERVCADHPNLNVRPFAVSNFSGRASFSVPTRMGNSANPDWPPGTSYDGMLGAHYADTVEVEVVRLDAEPQYDFVKLDLQGGEMSALEGLGNTIRGVKLIYAENQLLAREGTVGYLRDKGFICCFDRLQFGFAPETSWLALELLEQLGLKISHMNLPTKGVPFFCLGYFDVHADPVDENGQLSDETIRRFKDAGIIYLQTDILAINAKAAGDLLNFI
ncbi:hypothetical protein SLG_21790 [Sphingobium sp. SYK-6]|uniref:FkbM family methyltransferase n=1 Tax=Sphingobium sp. (strain NBRC 103272 / SYK-6) TaxID=627192 RepID=UPI00022770AE|nr:FkbM family methyltransferase [Sphingobium sp. SYK-6]BAK66854.1 hypothetical protein SLG_21790 [Sphingobium sp. SYK-6]